MSSCNRQITLLHETWKDVELVAESEVEQLVVAIQYSEYDRELLRVFRGVSQTPERSQRVYDLTTEVIGVNAASYTAWQMRWECVLALQLDLEEELGHNADVVTENPKNYQDWNHRRKCASALGPNAMKQELDFCASVLEDDAKNYHVWAHRQHVVRACQAWQDELQFTARLIVQDVRNNSAWNQRMFALRGLHMGAAASANAPSVAPAPSCPQPSTATPGTRTTSNAAAPHDPPAAASGGWLDEHSFQRELAMTKAYILCAPNNEAVWRYLTGLLDSQGAHALVSHSDAMLDLVQEVVAVDHNCAWAWSLLSNVYEAQAEVLLLADDPRAQQMLEAAQSVFTALQQIDPLRAGYWSFKGHMLSSTAATVDA